MKTLNLTQGTPEWHQHRADSYNASDAPSMNGDSKYTTRDELLAQRKYGIEKEISPHLQSLFDKGHAAEASIRPVVEKLIGADLYPVTGYEIIEGMKLSSSYDGLTMKEDIDFEHKLWNEKLAQAVRNKELEPTYYWQLEQQLLISGAAKAIFVVSDGTEANMEYMWYEPVPGRAEELIAGWVQFGIDLMAFEHTEAVPTAVAEKQTTLPAVSIQVKGALAIIDNLESFGTALTGYVDNINREPENDQDFVNLEASIKTLKTAEDALTFAENNALSQAENIDIMRRSVENYREKARQARLDIEKLVKSEKENRKVAIVNSGRDGFQKHIDVLNESLGGVYVPTGVDDFATVVKGKKNLASMQSAINNELARVKILANETAEKARANLKLLADNKEHEFLFKDISHIVLKENEDFASLVKVRISEYETQEDEKKKAAERVAETVKEKPAASGLSPENQGFVDEMNGVSEPEKKEPVKKLTKAQEKKRDADIKKLQKFFIDLGNVKMPVLTDPQCVAIVTKAVEKIIEMQDYVDTKFPAEAKQEKVA